MTKPLAPPSETGRAAAIPLVFDRTIGLYQPETKGMARRDIAVLMVSPWGYEEMCLRKSLRIFSEQLADAGIASFRFDYPGTGDAIDEPDAIAGLSVWIEATRAAAELLKRTSHAQRLVLVGQGVGALIAHQVAPLVDGVVSVVLMAPVTSGRLYLREVDIWAKLIHTDLGLGQLDGPPGQVSIAGLTMPAAVAADLRKINLLQDPGAVSGPYWVYERANRPADRDLSDKLEQSGAKVERRSFEGYENLVTMPLTARVPEQVFCEILGLCKELGAIAPRMPAPALPNEPQEMAGDGFIETPVRFGRFNHLSGILCRPDGAITESSVVFLGTAYDRHSGWGRSGTTMARELARRGGASLRFDAANVADSPPKPGDPDHVLYSETQFEDAIAAFDLIETAFPRPFVVAGRCSGAYLGVRVVQLDARPKGMVGVNPYVFYWDAAHPVHTDVSIIPRSLNDYGKRMVSMQTVRRIVSGEVNIRAAARNVIVAIAKRLSHRLAPILRWLPSNRSIAVEVNRTFRTINERKLPYRLIYCEGDVGLDHLYSQFGTRGHNLERYPTVKLQFLDKADHNLTPPHARQAYFDAILAVRGG